MEPTYQSGGIPAFLEMGAIPASPELDLGDVHVALAFDSVHDLLWTATRKVRLHSLSPTRNIVSAAHRAAGHAVGAPVPDV